MPTKRDLVQEIISRRKRLRRGGTHADYAESRAFALFVAMDHLRRLELGDTFHVPAMKREMLRYFAVGLVACLEGYYRLVIRDLIEGSPTARENAAQLRDIRLDVPTVLRMQDERVTPGEFLAHMLPISSPDDINRHMSALLGVDYFANVRGARTGPETLAEADPRFVEVIRSMFQDRHIACHELHPRNKLTFKRAENQWRSTLLLIEADEHLRTSLSQELAGSGPPAG